jgi:hypothetical protein
MLHDGFEAVGSDVLNASPSRSTATQSDSDAHETALGVLPESNAAGVDQPSDGAASAGADASDAPSVSATITAGSATRAIWRRFGRSGVLVISLTPMAVGT